jgi:hypothetical protein
MDLDYACLLFNFFTGQANGSDLFVFYNYYFIMVNLIKIIIK